MLSSAAEVFLLVYVCPALYTDLLRRDVTDVETIELFEVIHRDISRTFTKHHLFSEPGGIGQYSLLRVLRAYALYNPKVRTA